MRFSSCLPLCIIALLMLALSAAPASTATAPTAAVQQDQPAPRKTQPTTKGPTKAASAKPAPAGAAQTPSRQDKTTSQRKSVSPASKPASQPKRGSAASKPKATKTETSAGNTQKGDSGAPSRKGTAPRGISSRAKAASATARQKARTAKLAPLIVIDPGHGGDDPGAVSNRVTEKDVALGVAKRLQAELQRMGFRVRLTRSTDASVSLQQRIRFTTLQKPALFLSLHCNSGPSTSMNGLETFAFLPERRHRGWASVVPADEVDIDTTSADVANKLHETLMQQGGTGGIADNGVRLGRFAVLTPRPWPSVLVEMGYLSNRQDAAKLGSPTYRARFASQLAKAVAQTLRR